MEFVAASLFVLIVFGGALVLARPLARHLRNRAQRRQHREQDLEPIDLGGPRSSAAQTQLGIPVISESDGGRAD